MKPTLKITTLIVAMLLLFSCKKKGEDIWNNNALSTLMNGTHWSVAYTYVASSTDSTIVIVATSEGGYSYNTLSFIVNKTLERQSIFSDYGSPNALCIFSNSIEDGHATNETFEVLKTADNWFEIEEANNEFKHIKGKFEVTLVKTRVGVLPTGLPDTLVFKNGTFDISY